MTDADRIELLKEVARVAPKEMGAEFEPEHTLVATYYNDETYDGFYTEGPSITFRVRLKNNDSSEHRLYLDESIDDNQDAAAVFAMLDAMEGARYATKLTSHCLVVVGPNAVTDGFTFSATEITDVKVTPRRFECSATSRAEAVARAFVQVFGVVA